MRYRVFFSPEAQTDLLDLYDYIAERSDSDRALGYIERIEEWCRSLHTFPERGHRRDDVRSGMRVMGFEHRTSIAFQVGSETVVILRISYGGRQVEEMSKEV